MGENRLDPSLILYPILFFIRNSAFNRQYTGYNPTFPHFIPLHPTLYHWYQVRVVKPTVMLVRQAECLVAVTNVPVIAELGHHPVATLVTHVPDGRV